MSGRRRLLCRMLRTVPTRVSGGVGEGGRVVLRNDGSCKPHVEHLRSRHDRELTNKMVWTGYTERKGKRDVPKRCTRPLRLALVRTRPMCVPGLRPPAVSWIHACEEQTEDRLIVAVIAGSKLLLLSEGCVQCSNVRAAPRFARDKGRLF
jgi:hypothetical protein